MRLAPLLAVLLVPSAAVAAPKKDAAGAKSVPACGVKVLPLVAGNQWTYSSVAAPQAAAPDIARLSPPLAKTFVITVKSVETKGPDTVVSLEEKVIYDLGHDPKKPILDERTINSTITCNAKKFDISPDSFFFAGEPGGYMGVTLDKMDRLKGTSWQLTNGTVGDAEWPEDLVFHFVREPSKDSNATFSPGKLELERRFTPQQPEGLVTKTGSYKAEKIAVKTTGRITLDKPQSADLKPMELPADWVNQIWLVEGLGVVQTLNHFAHMYQLVDSQLK